jgi:CheY-like chemotaxis protein
MPKKILIVDDEDDIRDVVQVSLEEFAGWQTISAASGLEGLQLAKTEKPDAILLDLSMPDMDGLQLCRALQSLPETQNIPIIVLTAKVLPDDRQELTDLKALGMITKPFDPTLIWKQVTEILGWSA